MGSVYLARDSQLERDVALKVPKFGAGTDEKLVTRFYREARSVANLSHPNLCPVFDVGEIDGTHYIAMAQRATASNVQPTTPDDGLFANLPASAPAAATPYHRSVSQ